jgi:hypothetical protein
MCNEMHAILLYSMYIYIYNTCYAVPCVQHSWRGESLVAILHSYSANASCGQQLFDRVSDCAVCAHAIDELACTNTVFTANTRCNNSGMDVAVAVKMSKLEKARLPSGTIRLSGLRLKARLLLSIEVCKLLCHILSK